MSEEATTTVQEKAAPSQTFWTRDFVFIALINLATFIGFNMTNTGMPLYVASLGANELVAGLVISLATGVTLFIRPFAGLAIDRLGRKGMLLIGLGSMVLVTAAYTVFPILAVILALRCVHGIAWSLSSTSISTIAADIIPRKRFAEGMGYFALSAALGSAIAPALSLAIIENYGATLMFTLAAGSIFVGLILALLFKSAPVKPVGKRGPIKLSDLFERSAFLPAVVALLVNCAFGSIVAFVALAGQARGVSDIWLFFTIYALVTLVSRPVTGKIIDRKGFFGPGVVSIIGVVITLVIIAFSDNIVMFCIAGIFAGVGIGTGMGTFQTMAVASVSPQRRGVATSTYFFGFDAGITIGSLAAGALATAFGYTAMYLLIALLPAIGLVVFIVGLRRQGLRPSQAQEVAEKGGFDE